MWRVFHTHEDQKLFNRWLLGIVAFYSAAALMVVVVASLWATARDTTISARIDPAAFAWSVKRKP